MALNLMKSGHSVAKWLLCEVRDALKSYSRDPITRAYVATGAVAWDDCCGMLVVTPETVYRSIAFPSENGNEEFCYAGEIAMNLNVLLMRCVPVMDNQGRPPSAASLDAAYEKLLVDSSVIWNAITLAELPENWERAGVRQTFVGADGGCIGVETRLSLGIAQKDWKLK